MSEDWNEDADASPHVSFAAKPKEKVDTGRVNSRNKGKGKGKKSGSGWQAKVDEVYQEELAMMRRGEVAQFQVDMTTVKEVEDEKALSVELSKMLTIADEKNAAGQIFYVGFDTESENMFGKRNRTCSIQFTYRNTQNCIMTVVIRPDHFAVPTGARNTYGQDVLRLPTVFDDLLHHDAIVFVAAAAAGDLTGMDEIYEIRPGAVRICDIAEAYWALRRHLDLEQTKETYGLKDVFNYAFLLRATFKL